MLQGVPYPVVVYGRGDVVGGLFGRFGGVAHGYTNARMAEHAYIVPTVAETHAFLYSDVEITADVVYSLLLCGARFGQVGKGRIPTVRLAMGKQGAVLLLFVYREERGHLKDVPPDYFRCLRVWHGLCGYI